MMSHKKIHRFMVEHIPSSAIGDQVTILDQHVAKQIHRVLKIRPGEVIQCFSDGGPEYTMIVDESTSSLLMGTVTAVTAAVSLPRTVIAAVSIVKGDAFELIVQKLTELGVHTIIPLIANRTVKQSVRIDRLQTISDEAVEQCGGFHRVRITEPLSLAACFEQYPFESVVLDPLTVVTSLEAISEKVVCYVGPEGGWDEHDETVMEFFNPRHLKITDRVLRTETAAILGVYSILWR